MSLSTQNRNDSYAELNLSESQVRVYKALQAIAPATNQQIAEHLGVTINRVTGRVKELRDEGIVYEKCSVPGPFGKSVTMFDLTNIKDGQLSIF